MFSSADNGQSVELGMRRKGTWSVLSAVCLVLVQFRVTMAASFVSTILLPVKIFLLSTFDLESDTKFDFLNSRKKPRSNAAHSAA